MQTFWHNLRHALRMLVRKPSFTLAAVIALALGIGANTAIFSLVDAVLLRPLPGIAKPGELVEVVGADTTFSYPDYLDYRNQSESFSGLAAYRVREMSLGADAQPEIIGGALVSANYFSVLGVEVRGRAFIAEEDERLDANPVAVISHELWQKKFNGEPSAIGKSVRLNGQSFTVIGITPAGFKGTRIFSTPDLWIPITAFSRIATGSLTRLSIDRRGWGWLGMVGRLRDGMGIEQARTETSLIARRIQETYNPRDREDPTPKLYSATVAATGIQGREDFLRFIGMLLAIVALALLIACANVASLLLVRATERAREISIRLALGARRGQIVAQLLTESVLLFLLGGTVSLIFAMWAMEFLSAIVLPGDTALASATLELNPLALVYTLMVSLLCGVLFGLAPALQASRHDLVTALKERVGGSGKSRLRDGFVVAQVALSVIFLIGAGLFIKSLQKALATDVGFNTQGVALASINAGLQRYDASRARTLYRQIGEQVAALPGVESVSWSTNVPISPDADSESFRIVGHTPRPDERLATDVAVVGAHYFQTMGIPLAAGREFSEQDTESSPAVILINEAFARRFFGDENPLGKRIIIADTEVTVIGVAKDSCYNELNEKPKPFVYGSLNQLTPLATVTIMARTASNPQALFAALERAIHQADPDLPVFKVKTLEDHLGALLVPQRLAASLLSLFGLLALALTMVGIYSVIAYSVSQRTHEIGVRMAMGAQAADVFKLIVRQGLILALIGATAGIAVAVAVTRLLASLLLEVSATDPLIYVAIVLLLGLATFVACYIPARRAMKVDPMVALRYE